MSDSDWLAGLVVGIVLTIFFVWLLANTNSYFILELFTENYIFQHPYDIHLSLTEQSQLDRFVSEFKW